MTVEIVAVMGIDAFAQIGDVLIGRAHVDGVGARECSVSVVAGRCAGEDVNFVRTALGMLFFSTGGDSLRDKFRCAGGGEARETDSRTVFNHFGGFLSRNVVECHYDICFMMLFR